MFRLTGSDRSVASPNISGKRRSRRFMGPLDGELADLVKGQVGDRALAVRRAVDRAVVHDHELTRLAALDVELHHDGTEGDGVRERDNRVGGLSAAVPLMGADAAGGHRRHVERAADETQRISRILDLKELHALGLARVGLVEGEEQLAVERAEEHAVSAVLGVEDLVLRPRARELACGRFPQQHAVAVSPDEVRPDHVEVAVLGRAVEEGTVRHVSRARHRVARRKQRLRRRGERGEVLREGGVAHPSVVHLTPLMAEHHVGLSVLHVERAVERHPLLGRERPRLHGLERPERALRLEHPRAARREVLRLGLRVHRLDRRGAFLLSESCEEVVGALVLVYLRRPDGGHGHALWHDHCGFQLAPVLEVGTRAHGDALAAEPRLRLVEVVGAVVSKHERVADAEVLAEFCGRQRETDRRDGGNDEHLVFHGG